MKKTVEKIVKMQKKSQTFWIAELIVAMALWIWGIYICVPQQGHFSPHPLGIALMLPIGLGGIVGVLVAVWLLTRQLVNGLRRDWRKLDDE